MSTTRGDGSTISSGIGSEGSGTIHAGGGDISSGFGPTPSGTVHAGGPDISSGFGPAPASAGIHVNIGDPVVINTITYKYEGVISKSTGEAEIFLLSHNGKKCVFKLYYPNFRPKEDIVKLLKQLKHEDIINVLDYGYYHDRFFEIMDYAEGGTLEQHLPIKDISRLKKILAETVNAYKFCHANGIIHKDIKPQNLYFKNADGTNIVIGDFGISSSLEGGMSRHLTSQSLTVGYAAPEMYGVPDRETRVIKIYVGKEVDYYALGITLIHIWDGKSPFDGLNPYAIANLTTSGKVHIPEDSPKDMQQLVKGLITVDYTKRWGYEEIQRWLNGEDVPVHFQVKEISHPPFHFSPSEEVTTTEELAKILKKNPSDIGKKKLYSGKLSAWVNIFDQGLAAELDRIIEDDYPKDQDAGFQKAIYLLDVDEPFAHNGKECRTVEELAGVLEEDFPHYLSALGNPNHRFYLYLEAHDAKKEVDTFRKYFQTFSAKKALNTIILELRGRDSFKLGDELFFTPEELLKYKDQQFLVKELKDRESKPSLWIDGTSFHEIKAQLETWRGLKKCDEATLAYVSATGNGIPQIGISKASFSYSDLRIGTSSSDSFTINNKGGGVLSGSITSNKKWLKVSQGDIDKSQRKQDIKFSVDTAGLPFGFRETGIIEIQSNVGLEIVEINISVELGIKAAARFRTGMTIGGSLLGALVGFAIYKFNFVAGSGVAPETMAGVIGAIGISVAVGMAIKRGKGSFTQAALTTLFANSLLLYSLNFFSHLAFFIVSWAMVLALMAYITSPTILRSLQVGNKLIPVAIGIGTVVLSAVIIFVDLEAAKQLAEVKKTKKAIAKDKKAKKVIATPEPARNLDVDISAKTPNGLPVLIGAVINNNTNLIKMLLDKGADVNAKDNKGNAALIYAVERDNIEAIKILLDAGADLNSKSSKGVPALILAAAKGNAESVKALLDRGADAKTTATGTTESGGTFSSPTSALNMALASGNAEIVKMLLEKGADVNERGYGGIQRLSSAVFKGDAQIVQVLLDKGADLNARDDQGGTVLFIYPGSKCDKTIYKMLLDKGADVNAKNNRGETTLYSAVYNEADIEIVKMLLDKGVDVNAQDSKGQTALFWAAFGGHAEIVQALLGKEADINIKDKNGSTVFNFAHEPKIMEMLKKHGALK